MPNTDAAHAALSAISRVCRMDKPPSGPFMNWPPGRPIPPLTIDPDAPAGLTFVQSQFPSLSVGLIQFDDPAKPTFFGWNQDTECDLGSLGKISIVYAAFQLRDDVRQALAQPHVNAANIDAKLRQMWGDSCVAELPTTAGKAPYLDRIFDFTLDPVDFRGYDPLKIGIPLDFTIPPGTDQLDDVHELEYETDPNIRWAQLLDLNFAQQLWLTSRWSDNAAATVCAAAIGMPYIFAVLKNSGLYRDSGSGSGLRLLKAYETPPTWHDFSTNIERPSVLTDAEWNAKLQKYRRFIQPFGPADFFYQPEIDRISRVTGIPGNKVPLKQGSNVTALASLMVSLVQGNLIRPDTGASTDPAREMASFLRLPKQDGYGTVNSAGSFIVSALRNPDSFEALTGSPASKRYVDVWSKIGVDEPLFSDWAYIKAPPGKQVGIIVMNFVGTNRDADGHLLWPYKDDSCDFNQCVRALVAAL